MREFVFNYAEYILAPITGVIVFFTCYLVDQYRYQMNEEQKSNLRHVLFVGVIGIPLTVIAALLYPELIGISS